MPGADFYRALATVKFIQDELLHEHDAQNAMKLCFEKIHQSLDMFHGHYINRVRFHLNRHHTEYLRKVRVMRRERGESQRMEEENEAAKKALSTRRSARVGVAQDLANDVEQLKNIVRRKDLEIDRLTMLLDEKIETIPHAKQPAREMNPPKLRRLEKLLNPYLPSSDEDDSLTPMPPRPADTQGRPASAKESD